MRSSPTRLRFPIGEAGHVHVVVSDRSCGDMHVDQPEDDLTPRRRALAPTPWTWLRQVHGHHVVQADRAGDGAGTEADAAVSAAPEVTLAVQIADCAPIAMFADEGVIGVVHAGWRGLVAGVVQQTADHMRSLGATRVSAVLGPCIAPDSYEFSTPDLEPIATRFGDAVRGRTSEGMPALDLPATVVAALAGTDVELVARIEADTACPDERWFSHRARSDAGRQAMAVWRSQ